MKMCERFTARYSDGRTVYEKPLEWIYANQNGAQVEVSPCIWLRKHPTESVYFVDFIGAGLGCTCGAFDTLREAEAFREKLAQMEQSEFSGWLLSRRTA